MKQTKQFSDKVMVEKAIKQLADSLPKVQYAYHGIMSGREAKETLKVRKTLDGQPIAENEDVVVNQFNFVNHRRRIRKILLSSKTQEQFEARVLDYIDEVKKTREKQVQYAQQVKVKRSPWYKQLLQYFQNLLLQIAIYFRLVKVVN